MLQQIFLPKQYFLLDQIFLAVTGLPLVCQPQIPLSTTAAFCSLHPPFLYTSIYKHTLTYKTQLSTSLTWFHIVLKYLLLIFSSFFVHLFPPHISYLIFVFVLNYCPIYVSFFLQVRKLFSRKDEKLPKVITIACKPQIGFWTYKQH